MRPALSGFLSGGISPYLSCTGHETMKLSRQLWKVSTDFSAVPRCREVKRRVQNSPERGPPGNTPDCQWGPLKCCHLGGGKTWGGANLIKPRVPVSQLSAWLGWCHGPYPGGLPGRRRNFYGGEKHHPEPLSFSINNAWHLIKPPDISKTRLRERGRKKHPPEYPNSIPIRHGLWNNCD